MRSHGHPRHRRPLARAGHSVRQALAALLDFTNYWVYLVGPIAGACLAVGVAWILRGPGGGASGSAAAQGRVGRLETRKTGET